MIQRKQTLFLLFAVIAIAICLFLPVASIAAKTMGGDTMVYNLGVVGEAGMQISTTCVPLFLLLAVSAIIALVNIFLYKNLKLQKSLCSLASAIYLSNEAIFGSRQIFSSTTLIVILNLVDELGRMFQTHTYGDAFCLDIYLCRSEIAVYIAGTMTCCQDNRSAISFLSTRSQIHGFYAYHPIASCSIRSRQLTFTLKDQTNVNTKIQITIKVSGRRVLFPWCCACFQ